MYETVQASSLSTIVLLLALGAEWPISNAVQLNPMNTSIVVSSKYLKVIGTFFCDFDLKYLLRVLNFAICTRKWYRIDKF